MDNDLTPYLRQLAEERIGPLEWKNQKDTMAYFIDVLLVQCTNLTTLVRGSQLLRPFRRLPRIMSCTWAKRGLQRLRYFRLDGCGTDDESRTKLDLYNVSKDLDWRLYLAFFNSQSLREMDTNLQEHML